MKKYILGILYIFFFYCCKEKGVAEESITEGFALLSGEDTSLAQGTHNFSTKIDRENQGFSFHLGEDEKIERDAVSPLTFLEAVTLEEKWKKFCLEQTYARAEGLSSLLEEDLNNFFSKWVPASCDNLYELSWRFPSNKKISLKLLVEKSWGGKCHNYREVKENYRDQCIERYLKLFNLEVLNEAERQQLKDNHTLIKNLLLRIKNFEEEILRRSSFPSPQEEVKNIEPNILPERRENLQILKATTIKNFFSALSQEEEYYRRKRAEVRGKFKFYYSSLLEGILGTKADRFSRKEKLEKLRECVRKELCVGENLYAVGFLNSVEKVFELNISLNEIEKNIEFLRFLSLIVEIWGKLLKNPFMNYGRCINEHFSEFRFFKNFDDIMKSFTTYVNKGNFTNSSKSLDFFCQNIEGLQKGVQKDIDLSLVTINSNLKDFLWMASLKNTERSL